jgi:hypothetical protein
MRNLRQRGTALALSVLLCAGMVMFSPTTAHASSDRSIEARCANLARGIAAATAAFGAESALVVYLQGLYNANCVAAE